MRTRVVAAAFLAALGLGASFTGARADAGMDDHAQAETKAPLLGDVRLARQALETIHPGYTRYTPPETLDGLWAGLEAQAADPTFTREDLIVELSRITSAIRCDHTKLEFPADMEAGRNETPTHLPFRFVMFDGRMFVDVPGETELARGEEILAIDGRPVDVLYASIAPLLPVDGFNDHKKPLLFANDGELLGSGLDHFAPLMLGAGEDVQVTARGANGAPRTVQAPRINFAEFQALTGDIRFGRNFSDEDAVTVVPVGEDGAILNVETFVNYRTPVDPDTVYGLVMDRLKAEGRTKLIVDLRRNGGGSFDAQDGLIRHLIDEPLAFADAMRVASVGVPDEIAQHIDTWDRSVLTPPRAFFGEQREDGLYDIIDPRAGAPDGPIPPADNAFDGQLVFLTGPTNASGATHLLAAMRTAGRATLVGERTGGAPTGATAGTILFLELPESGVRVRVPVIRTVMANAGELPQDHGLDPDVFAPMTREAYFAGRDPAMEAAKAALGLN